eukprot:PhF_6_TR40917/c0_g1_i1/m.61895
MSLFGSLVDEYTQDAIVALAHLVPIHATGNISVPCLSLIAEYCEEMYQFPHRVLEFRTIPTKTNLIRAIQGRPLLEPVDWEESEPGYISFVESSTVTNLTLWKLIAVMGRVTLYPHVLQMAGPHSQTIGLYTLISGDMKSIERVEQMYGVECFSVPLKETMTATMLANLSGNIDAVKYILGLRGRGSVLEREPNGGTVAMWAALGSLECLQYMQSLGLSMTDRDDEGISVVLWAARGECPKVLEYLLMQEGVDPNDRNDNGETILMKTVLGEKVQMVKTALRLGCGSLTDTDKKGVNLIHYLCKSNIGVTLTKYLLPKIVEAYGGNVEILNKEAEGVTGTPFQRALSSNNVRAAKYLVECGADPSRKSRDNTTSLMWAACSGNEELMDWCHKLGGGDWCDKVGMTSVQTCGAQHSDKAMNFVKRRIAESL